MSRREIDIVKKCVRSYAIDDEDTDRKLDFVIHLTFVRAFHRVDQGQCAVAPDALRSSP